MTQNTGTRLLKLRYGKFKSYINRRARYWAIFFAVYTLLIVFSLYGKRVNKKGLSGSSILNTWWLILPYFPHELPDDKETRHQVKSARLAHVTAWILGGAIYMVKSAW
jgi:hypothetical protein